MVTTELIIHIAQVANPFPKVNASSDTVSTILNIVFSVIGALTFLFVVIGGFRYVISQGKPEDASKAKNTIIYALIGLAITISAAAIVNFVFGKISL